jgi:hypothetical protein
VIKHKSENPLSDNNLTRERIMRKIIFLTALLAFILTSSSWAADISGKWTLKMWGAGAEESVPLVIKAAGENLTVSCTHPAFKEMTGTGTLKGDAISFNLKSSSMEIGFTGKVSGNKMTGTREVKSAGKSASGGAAGGASGAQGQAPAASGQGTQGGQAPAGGQGGTAGAQGVQGSGQGGAAGAQGGGQASAGGAQAQGSEDWTAEKN